MLRIYGSARSRGVRTLWMVGELGLQYEHLDYAPRSPQTRTQKGATTTPPAARSYTMPRACYTTRTRAIACT